MRRESFPRICDAAGVAKVAVPPSADAVVVGGGCMGASTAFHLARRGLRVVVLERHHIASGSTGHSGAIVRRLYEARIGVRLARAGLGFFQRFEEETGHPCGFVETGILSGARARDVPALEALIALMRSEGVDARAVSPREAKALAPHLAVDDLAAAAFDPESGYADPILTAAGFAGAAEANGAHLAEGVRVEEVTAPRGSERIVRWSRGRIAAGSVIVAAGTLTNRVLPKGAAAIPMRFEPGEVAIFRRPAGSGDPPPVYFDVYGNTYSRPEGSRDVLAGYMKRPPERTAVRPEPFDETLPMATARDLRRRLALRFPIMARAQPRGGWVGLYDVTPDGYPVVDRVADRVYACAGFSGHGFKLSPRIGELLAEFVATGKRPADLEPLRATRFAEKRPVVPEAPFPARRGSRLP